MLYSIYQSIINFDFWELCPPPLGGGHIIFAFSGVCRPASAICRHTWFPVISRKSIYPIFNKFGMGVYWVNSLQGIAFGEDSSIANRVIAT